MTMWLIGELNYQADLLLVVIAVIVGFTFGYFAFRAKTADLSGLFSAALVGIILLVFAAPQGAQWFLIMLSFFILGSAATKYKFEYKKRIGVEQGRGGARGTGMFLRMGLLQQQLPFFSVFFSCRSLLSCMSAVWQLLLQIPWQARLV